MAQLYCSDGKKKVKKLSGFLAAGNGHTDVTFGFL